jgi:hypothetical protein
MVSEATDVRRDTDVSRSTSDLEWERACSQKLHCAQVGQFSTGRVGQFCIGTDTYPPQFFVGASLLANPPSTQYLPLTIDTPQRGEGACSRWVAKLPQTHQTRSIKQIKSFSGDGFAAERERGPSPQRSITRESTVQPSDRAKQ